MQEYLLVVLLHDLTEDVGDLGELVEDLGGDLVLVAQLGPATLHRGVGVVIRRALNKKNYITPLLTEHKSIFPMR